MTNNELFHITNRNLNADELNTHLFASALGVGHLNIRSVNANFDDFKVFFDFNVCSNFKLFALTETWNILNPNLFHIDGLSLNTTAERMGEEEVLELIYTRLYCIRV